MSRLSKFAVGVTTVLLALAAAGAAATPVVAEAIMPSVAPLASVRAAGQLDLHGDGVTSGTSARGGFRKWEVRRLHYYETMPAKWDWSLSTAVAKWNASGAGITLVRTTSRSRAQLTVSYGGTGAAGAMATVGATRGAWIRLNPAFSRADAYDPWQRVSVMALFAHELGHVLGFGHSAPSCSLMHPVLYVDDCGYLDRERPGHYRCRVLDTALVARSVRIYGGRARQPSPSWCLIEALPPSLTGVAFGGGSDSPVTIDWGATEGIAASSRVLVRLWPAEGCGDAPAWAEEVRVLPGTRTWRDTEARRTGPHCFTVQLVNRYGAGRAVASRGLWRWVSPRS